MFDGKQLVDRAPPIVRALAEGVASSSNSALEQKRALERECSLVDSMASAAYHPYRGRRLAVLVRRVYQLTHSAETANALGHLGQGKGIARYARPSTAAHDNDATEAKFPALPTRDWAAGSDNANHQQRHANLLTASKHPSIHSAIAKAVFELADEKQNTNAQYEDLEMKRLGDAPLDAPLPTPDDTKILVENRNAEFAKRMATDILQLGGSVSAPSGLMCRSRDCECTEIFAMDAKTCSDCGEQTLQPLLSVLPGLAGEPNNKPAAVPASHIMHPQPVTHDRQTIQSQAKIMCEFFKAARKSPEAKQHLIQWLCMVGDVTTVEFCQKAAAKEGWEEEWLFILGRLHELIYLGKSVMDIFLDLGGPELAAAGGWWSARQHAMVHVRLCPV